jgi:putative membrane protein
MLPMPLPGPSTRRARALGASAGAAIGWVLLVPGALAHGPAPSGPPDIASLLLGWTFPPVPTLAILVAALAWRWAVRRVDAAHASNRVPRIRSYAFYGALAAIAWALLSGVERFDTTLFSVHMIQHILLTLVAAPLLALSAPVTLLLRVASPGTRRRWILPVLHSRVVRVLAFPVVAWIAFAGVMWVSHFSPLFDAALEDPLIHDVEHALFLGSALLFWWPAVALDPAPWRMGHPARILYVFLQMTQNTFLSVVILSASVVLYPHYATIVRAWGPTPLADQATAAGLMWILGDAVFILAIMAIVAGWMRAEDRAADRADRRADEAYVEIRAREQRLAERLARERESSG